MIKFIPTAFTLANLTCGFLAILVGDLIYSPIIILIGAIFDVFDGYLARKLNSTSELGKELDSLADLVSFGVAPAYLYFQIAPSKEWIFYIAPIAIVLGGGYRLAKFNTLASSKYFLGMAIPASGLFIIGLIFAAQSNDNFISTLLNIPAIYIAIGLFILVMNLIPMRMFSLKSLSINRTNKIMMGILLISFIILLIIKSTVAIPVTIFIYIVLAIIMNLMQKLD